MFWCNLTVALPSRRRKGIHLLEALSFKPSKTQGCNIADTETGIFRAKKTTGYFRGNERLLSVAGSVRIRKKKARRLAVFRFSHYLIPYATQTSDFGPQFHFFFSGSCFECLSWYHKVDGLSGVIFAWGQPFLRLQVRQAPRPSESAAGEKAWVIHFSQADSNALCHLSLQPPLVLSDGSSHWTTELTRILISASHLIFF